MSFRIEIDRELCIGTGNCVFHAPQVFDQDDEGRSIVLDLHALPEEKVRFAADSCPVGAIRIIPTDDADPTASSPGN